METVGKKMASNEKTEMFMEEEKLKDFCSSESLPGLPLHRFKSCIIFGNGGEIGVKIVKILYILTVNEQ